MTGSESSSTPLVCRRPDILWRAFGGNVVLLPPEFDQPLVVGGSGAALWDALATPVTSDDVARTLAARYGVHPGELRPDIDRVLDDLSARGLLETA